MCKIHGAIKPHATAPLHADFSATAARARSSTLAQLPSRSRLAGLSHEPPTQTTLGLARKSGALSGVMPPVGQNLIPGSGAAQARSKATPPAGTAGKNFM